MSRSEPRSRKLKVTGEVIKTLGKLEPKHCKQVGLTILQLTQDATPHDSADLKGFKDYRRVDIGEYRVISVRRRNYLHRHRRQAQRLRSVSILEKVMGE